MASKFVSNLYNPTLMKLGRLNVVYAPMGSGKTTLFKRMLKRHKCLMVAPYRSCLDDFGLTYTYNETKKGLNHEFLYPANLIDAVTSMWVSASALTDQKVIQKATLDYVNNLPNMPFTHILFDEVDFMWTQASLTEIGTTKLYAKDAGIWEYILKALSSRFTLIGQTSTRIPTLGILDVGGQLQLGAKTSVRFDSITPVLVSKGVNKEQLFKRAIDKSMSETKQRPTLVYKQKFSQFDINYMDDMVKQGKRVLVVMRKENSPKVEMANGRDIEVLDQIGAIEADRNSITLQASHVHYKIIGRDTALDKITPSTDPYMYFDYIFINTSSSRQVSLNEVQGDEGKKVSVITIGTELNSTSHQAAGRFRKNRVEITHYLKCSTQKKTYLYQDLPSFSGPLLWMMLVDIDPTMNSYMLHGGFINPVTTKPDIAKKLQNYRQAEWMGKITKGKTNQKQKSKLNTYNAWRSTVSNWNQTQDMLFASYLSYCKSVGEGSYSEKYVKAKLTKAKPKQKNNPV